MTNKDLDKIIYQMWLSGDFVTYAEAKAFILNSIK